MCALRIVIKGTMIGQVAIAMALPGFNNVGCSAAPIVLSRNTIYFVYNNYYLHFVQK